MKHSNADDRAANWLRASRQAGRRADHGDGRWPARQATSRGGARQDRGRALRAGAIAHSARDGGLPGMPRNQGEQAGRGTAGVPGPIRNRRPVRAADTRDAAPIEPVRSRARRRPADPSS